MITSHAPGTMGFSIKKGLRKVGHVAKVATLAPVKATVAVTKYATNLALKPIRSRINAMANRRATKLSTERRRSKTPTAAEHAEARTWTKRTLAAHGPQGKILSLLAGAPPAVDDAVLLGVVGGQLGVAPVVVAAAIPALTALLTQIMHKSASSGELDARGGASANVNVQTSPANAQVYIPQEDVQAVQQGQRAYQAAQTAYSAGQDFVNALTNLQPGEVDYTPPSARVQVQAEGGFEAGGDMQGAVDSSTVGAYAFAGTLAFVTALGLHTALRRG